MTGHRLRRVNSSTLSLNKTKKKLLTVEELYVEVLYTILHMIGCDIDQVGTETSCSSKLHLLVPCLLYSYSFIKIIL